MPTTSRLADPHGLSSSSFPATQAEEKERRSVAAAEARVRAECREEHAEEMAVVERRERQLQQDVRALHDQMQQSNEANHTLREANSALQQQIAALDTKFAELMEEYRTTLELLPGFQPDNPWVL